MEAIFYDTRLDPHRIKCTVYGHNNGKFRLAFRFQGHTHIMIINRVTGAMCLECPATHYFKCDKDDALKGMTEKESVYHALNIMITTVYADIVVVARPEDFRGGSRKGEQNHVHH